MELFFILIIGLCIGSFLNVCIYRIAREENIAFPPSHCTSCGYELKAKDLIPVLSWLFLRGKCRKCGEKISFKYPMVEILNGVIYMLIFLKYGMSVELVKFCTLTSLLIVMGFIDFETKYVFKNTVIFGVVTGVVFLAIECFMTKSIPLDGIIGGAIGFFVIGAIVVLTHGMGEGDIDIALICGMFLGVKGILVTLFVAFVFGGIVAAIILIFKLKNRKDEIAFGPYLVFGAIIAVLWADVLVSQYVRIFII